MTNYKRTNKPGRDWIVPITKRPDGRLFFNKPLPTEIYNQRTFFQKISKKILRHSLAKPSGNILQKLRSENVDNLKICDDSPEPEKYSKLLEKMKALTNKSKEKIELDPPLNCRQNCVYLDLELSPSIKILLRTRIDVFDTSDNCPTRITSNLENLPLLDGCETCNEKTSPVYIGNLIEERILPVDTKRLIARIDPEYLASSPSTGVSIHKINFDNGKVTPGEIGEQFLSSQGLSFQKLSANLNNILQNILQVTSLMDKKDETLLLRSIPEQSSTVQLYVANEMIVDPNSQQRSQKSTGKDFSLYKNLTISQRLAGLADIYQPPNFLLQNPEIRKSDIRQNEDIFLPGTLSRPNPMKGKSKKKK